MNGNNSFYFGANPDPLLGGLPQTQSDYDARLQSLRQQQAALEAMRNQAQHPVSKSPIWDKIDEELNGLSDMQKSELVKTEDFQNAAADVQAILNREYMNLMKPYVENTEDGKKALENQLRVVTNLKKTIVADTEQKLKEFEEWKRKNAGGK